MVDLTHNFFSHINTLSFTHDDSFLLSGSSDETLMVWSMECTDAEMTVSSELSLGPTFDVGFGLSGECILAAPDDARKIQVLRRKVLYQCLTVEYFVLLVYR